MRPDPNPQSVRLFYLLKKLNKCHREHQLLADGDRIALALSGGKDSCTLLDVLLQRRGLERYTIVAIHVLPASDMACGARAEETALRAWLETLGVTYRFVRAEEAGGEPRRAQQSPCFYCAWRRRKALFQAAQEVGCNKLAMAHNADDVAETTLLNLFYQAHLGTMQPQVPLLDGALTLIRPLSYVPEEEIVRYAEEAAFPPPPPPCPVAEDSKRTLMRQILRMVEKEQPRAKVYLRRAVERCSAVPKETN
jgi:tRNA(Ile)-lysidine synthase TilS/MesJ